MDVAEFKKAFSELRKSEDAGGEEESLASCESLIDVHERYVFVWSPATCCVLAVRHDDDGGKAERYRLVPTDTPLFHVSSVKASPDGRWISLSGPRGIYVVQLPARSPGGRGFVGSSGEEEEILCRVFPVGERFFATRSKNCVCRVYWHPGALLQPHLAVLSTDNCLRFFAFDSETSTGEFPEQTIQLDNRSSLRSSFGSSFLSVKGALGDTAVGFSFGQITNVDDKVQWPVYVLHGDGSIHFLMTGIGEDAIYQPTIETLKMVPESPDNYGNESCAILHLQPSSGSPPILVVATTSGVLYHCIVLGDGLHVYESVELELGFFPVEDKALNYPIALTADPSHPGRYFCSHGAGVHCVGLPMVSQLAELASTNDTVVSRLNEVPMAEEDSVVKHLICTNLSLDVRQANGLMGTCVLSQHLRSHLVCILSGYEIEVVPLSSSIFSPDLVGDCQERVEANQSIKRERFDAHIGKILQRTTSHPLIHASASAKVSSEELLNIITKSKKILKEEYLDRLEKARTTMELKVKTLDEKKRQQQAALVKLRKEKKALRDEASRLSEVYQDLHDNGEKLTSRLENAMSLIQRQLPVRSDAELKMERSLLEVARRMKDLKNGMQQIQTKEKYQLRQIRESKEKRQISGGDNNQQQQLKLGQKQLQSIKEVLQSNKDDIADLAEQVKALQKSLSV